MSIFTLLIQVVIALVVVTLYHLWVSSKKPVLPPAPKPLPVAPVIAAPVVAPPKLQPAPAPAPMPTPAAPLVESMTPEILAVISAAISVVLGRSHQIVAVQSAGVRGPEGNAWAMEGRVEQFLSHRVR
jgi:hypothetical protein